MHPDTSELYTSAVEMFLSIVHKPEINTWDKQVNPPVRITLRGEMSHFKSVHLSLTGGAYDPVKAKNKQEPLIFTCYLPSEDSKTKDVFLIFQFRISFSSEDIPKNFSFEMDPEKFKFDGHEVLRTQLIYHFIQQTRSFFAKWMK